MFGEDVFWIEEEVGTNLAVVLMPWGRDCLQPHLRRYHESGIDTIVSLLEPAEANFLGLKLEAKLAKATGMAFLNFPIQDVHVPDDIERFRAFVSGLAGQLRSGVHIGVHCRGSIGRSTVTAACTLIHLGWEPGAALEAVRKARGCEVPDTEEQRAWILSYQAQP